MRRGAIILNGISRKKQKFYSAIHPALTAKFAITVFETKAPGHARELARQAADDGFDFMLTAGGDGTLNQVVNGILESINPTLPPLGLIALGTGNDFARTCGIDDNPKSLIQLLIANHPLPTDVGKLSCHNQHGNKTQRYFINCCSLGMGPEVVQRLENSSRSLGPFLTYHKAIIQTFFAQKPPKISCTADDWNWHGKIRVLAVANAKSFGNAVYIAPDAAVDDGKLNLFIAGDFSTPRFLLFLHALKAKKKIADPGIVYKLAEGISLSSGEPVAIETEGELAGFLPAEVSIAPQKINFYR